MDWARVPSARVMDSVLSGRLNADETRISSRWWYSLIRGCVYTRLWNTLGLKRVAWKSSSRAKSESNLISANVSCDVLLLSIFFFFFFFDDISIYTYARENLKNNLENTQWINLIGECIYCS